MASQLLPSVKMISTDRAECETPSPLSRQTGIYKAGMPHLALGGLSENWLWKECGHRHWMLLAKAAGKPEPRFLDRDGTPVYAAFIGVSFTDGDLAEIKEHDGFTICSELGRISRTRFLSRHEVRAADDCRIIAQIEMTSVFVRRNRRECNHSICRIEVEEFCPIDQSLSRQAHFSQSWPHRERVPQPVERPTFEPSKYPEQTFRPCPALDFNGADFLYFASFQAFADRAEFEWFCGQTVSVQTSERQMRFYGNINSGESIHLQVDTAAMGQSLLSHAVSVVRSSDGLRIADIRTIKRMQ